MLLIVYCLDIEVILIGVILTKSIHLSLDAMGGDYAPEMLSKVLLNQKSTKFKFFFW